MTSTVETDLFTSDEIVAILTGLRAAARWYRSRADEADQYGAHADAEQWRTWAAETDAARQKVDRLRGKS